MSFTRRDFFNPVMAGSVASLLMPNHLFSAPKNAYQSIRQDWYGYGGKCRGSMTHYWWRAK